MIDVLTKIGRTRYQQDMEFTMRLLEKPYAVKIRHILGRQYLNTARYLEMGIYNVEHIASETQRMIKTVSLHYKRVASTMQNKVQEYLNGEKSSSIDFEMKENPSTMNVFWAAVKLFIAEQAVEQVTKVNNTTKSLLRMIVERGMIEGKTFREIAKEIRAIKGITNSYRAMVIAKTETHSVTIFSVDKAIVSSGLVTEREWMNAGDERVREDPFSHVAANGERVGVDEKFVKTGEPLSYPGDPDGSAANVILCRCVLLYLMTRKAVTNNINKRKLEQRRGRICYG